MHLGNSGHGAQHRLLASCQKNQLNFQLVAK